MRRFRMAALTVVLVAALSGTATAGIGFAPNGLAERAAVGEVGAPYFWGGTSPKTGFDSSGLVVWAYAQQGIRLPHYTEAIFKLKRATPVSRSALKPGDLVFFNDASHMGIYIGGGRFVHAPRTGATVTIASLTGRYAKSFTGAVRIGPLS
jgi:peptidoglycan DL-endopeptidase CwlO